MQQIFNKKAAAKALNISVVTLNRYTKNGRIPHRRIGDRVLYCESDLNAFIDACLIPASDIPSSREKHEMVKAIVRREFGNIE